MCQNRRLAILANSQASSLSKLQRHLRCSTELMVEMVTIHVYPQPQVEQAALMTWHCSRSLGQNAPLGQWKV